MVCNKLLLVLFVFAGVFAVGYTDCKLQQLVTGLNIFLSSTALSCIIIIIYIYIYICLQFIFILACDVMDCAPGYQCKVDKQTGVASCIPMGKLHWSMYNTIPKTWLHLHVHVY